MDAIITARDLCYSYAEEETRMAVQGVSFDIVRGEKVAIIGRNGSGKSTLAKLLNALFRPLSGELMVDGIDAIQEENVMAVRQKVGMVFQNPDNQIVATIVEEDVAFGLENLGVPTPEIRRRVDEALKMVRMADFTGAAPHMLSGGQKQRVAIAGVLAMRPRVIVMDEPTAMLDPQGRGEVLNTVLGLNRDEGITLIMITHFMEEAMMCDRVMVVDEGRIVMTGTPREIFKQAQDIKALGLDVPPMTDLSHRLKARGMDFKDDIMTVGEMVEEICRLKP